MSPWTKYPQTIVQMHFHEWKMFYIIRISPKIVAKGPIDINPALVQIMAWCRTGDKPLSEPMLTKFIDAYMRHVGGGQVGWVWVWVWVCVCVCGFITSNLASSRLHEILWYVAWFFFPSRLPAPSLFWHQASGRITIPGVSSSHCGRPLCSGDAITIDVVGRYNLLGHNVGLPTRRG